MLHQAHTDRYDRSILRWHTAFAREERHLVELIPQGGQLVTMCTEVDMNTVAVTIREEGALFNNT